MPHSWSAPNPRDCTLRSVPACSQLPWKKLPPGVCLPTRGCWTCSAKVNFGPLVFTTVCLRAPRGRFLAINRGALLCLAGLRIAAGFFSPGLREPPQLWTCREETKSCAAWR